MRPIFFNTKAKIFNIFLLNTTHAESKTLKEFALEPNLTDERLKLIELKAAAT